MTLPPQAGGDGYLYGGKITRTLRIGVEAQPGSGPEGWGVVKAIAADFSTVTMEDGRVLPTARGRRWEVRSKDRSLIV